MARAAQWLAALAGQFVEGTHVTIIARLPGTDRGDFLFSTDSIDGIRELIERIDTEPVTPRSAH